MPSKQITLADVYDKLEEVTARLDLIDRKLKRRDETPEEVREDDEHLEKSQSAGTDEA